MKTVAQRLGEIIGSLRFWAMFVLLVIIRFALADIENHSVKVPTMLVGSFVLALWSVWSWDYFMGAHLKK